MKKKKKYKFALPKRMLLKEIAEEFIANYDQIDEATREKTMLVYAGCFDPSGAFIYDPVQCPEGT